MSDNKTSEVVKAFKDNMKAEDPKRGNITQNAKGNGNIQLAGDNNTLKIETKKVVTRTKVITKPGKDHITDDQAFKLSQLVKEIVQTEQKLKKHPSTFQKVWGALNKKMKVVKYRLIPLSKYAKAELFLTRWLGRINNMKSASKKNPDWRKKRYSYIYTNIRQLDLKEKLNTYIKDKFNATSLKNLNDDDLKKVYNAVSSWKSSRK